MTNDNIPFGERHMVTPVAPRDARLPVGRLLLSPIMAMFFGIVLAVLMLAFVGWLCGVGALSTLTSTIRLMRRGLVGPVAYRRVAYPGG